MCDPFPPRHWQVLRGNQAAFVRMDELLQSWKIFEDVLQVCSAIMRSWEIRRSCLVRGPVGSVHDGIQTKRERSNEGRAYHPNQPLRRTHMHSTNILGHDIAVTSNRVVGGRIAAGGHGKPATFENIHEQVAAMEVVAMEQMEAARPRSAGAR